VTVHLADGNLLVALTVAEHVHHRAALDSFTRPEPDIATASV
jgi:hypothetical protein